jgi:uncharacterized membrane protein
MSTVPPSTPPPGGTYTPPPPPPPVGGSAPSSDRTLMIVLSYFGILCLIPLLTKKDDPEVQWHAKNGLAFVVFDIVLWIALFIVGMFLRHIPVAGCGIMTALNCIVGIGILVIHVMAIIKGVNGQRFRLPVVSDFADKM